MKKVLLFIVYIFLFVLNSKTQVNLVPNPSFEQLSQCPTFLSQLEYATPWFQPYTDSNGVQQSSTDLFSSCCAGFCGLINSSGTQLPRTGNTYAGAYYYINIGTAREFIEVKLNNSLSVNKSYCVNFYVNLRDKSRYATSNFGVYFSEDSCLAPLPPNLIPYIPQIENPYNNVITDKINWVPIELEYLAQGGENFITIGGFKPDSLSNVIIVDNSSQLLAYYYIDDVSVIDISTPAYAGVDTNIALGDSVFIGRQPEIGLNDDCVWYVNGNPIDTVAGLWVQPDSTTTYILEQTICGYITYDTVTVTVLPTGIDSYSNKNAQFEVFPNPANNTFTIKSQESIIAVFKLIDLTGKEILKQNITTNITQIDIQALPKGIYFYQITNKKEQYSGKLVVQ
ncbi:MAG: T9SS type A sorting domain-containing protein [Flavobacteriales bacterium]|nr:T9SS type A sorting domain-containing protein [Flavobacteriales bacterium]